MKMALTAAGATGQGCVGDPVTSLSAPSVCCNGISGKSKGEYTGNARARKENANALKRDQATTVRCHCLSSHDVLIMLLPSQILQTYLNTVEKTGAVWAKSLMNTGREAMEQFDQASARLHGLLAELGDKQCVALVPFRGPLRFRFHRLSCVCVGTSTGSVELIEKFLSAFDAKVCFASLPTEKQVIVSFISFSCIPSEVIHSRVD
jgi:hypothetical protein